MTPAAAQAPATDGAPPCWHLGQSIVVARGETLRCNLVVVGGDVTVEADGVVDGDVAVPFGRAVVDGEIRGDAFASGGLDLGARARILGDASSLGALEVAEGARVSGRVDRLGGPSRTAAAGLDVEALASGLASLLVLAVLAAITAALATNVVGEVVETARRVGLGSVRRALASLVVGAVTGVAGAFLAAFALLTVFLPVVVAALLAGAIAIGSTALALRVGTWMLPRAAPVARAAVGAAGLVVATFAPLLVGRLGPFAVGLALDLALLALVLGTGVLGAFEAWRRSAAGMALPAPAPGAARTAAAEAPGPAPESARAAPDGMPGDGTALPRSEHAPDPVGDANGPGPGDAAPIASEPAPLELGMASEDRDAAVHATPVAGPEAEAAPAAADPEERPAPSEVRDLDGMTPIYAHLLAGAGVVTLDDLGRATPEAVLRALAVPGVLPIDPARAAAWIEAARAGSHGSA